MKILALEFSSSQRSVAIVVDHRVCGDVTHAGERSVHAFDMITRALADAKQEREDIECIAIGLGPGSYTGIRAAISLAQGWQLARPVKVAGLSSVESLACEAQLEACLGIVNVVIDAQRGEFYLAQYDINKNGSQLTQPLRLVSRQEIETRASAGEMIVGPDAATLFKTGRSLFPRAARLAGIVEHRADFTPGEKLEPIYLREINYVKAQPPRVVRDG